MLRLPDTGAGPACSPWLEDDSTEQSSAPSALPELRLWMVPGLTIEWTEASDVLAALTAVAGDTLGPSPTDESGIALAADLRFAARVAEMVLELVTRGRVLPALERTTAGWRAAWRPLIDRADRSRIEELLWAFPATLLATSALAGDEELARGESGAETPGDALRSLMWGFTDALARRFASDRPPVDRPRRSRTTGPVDAWLAALVSSDGSVDADDAELAVFARTLDAWQATANTLVEPVRTCFRIVPPVGGDDDLTPGADDAVERNGDPGQKDPPEGSDEWRIEFALQAVDDPSLLVSADAVWADGPDLTALERHVAHPDEQLLGGLGRAARLVPSLGPALAAMTPTGQTTDATGILAFLRDSAPLLEDAGFGVLAPPWWRSSKARLSLRLKARTGSKGAVSTGTIGLEGLCDIRWEAMLGDDRIGLAELRQLAKLKQPLVRLRGQWVELHEEDLAAAITAVGKKGATRGTDVVRADPAHRTRPRASNVRPAGGRGRGRRLARGPPRRCRRPAPAVHSDAGWLRRRVAPLPGARPRLACISGRSRSRGVPCRRHGAREDGPAPRTFGPRAGRSPRSADAA